jgi:hypothetical protein
LLLLEVAVEEHTLVEAVAVVVFVLQLVRLVVEDHFQARFL